MKSLTDLTASAGQDRAQGGLSPAKQAEKLRLALALRENLKRRKAQSRNRRASGADDAPKTIS